MSSSLHDTQKEIVISPLCSKSKHNYGSQIIEYLDAIFEVASRATLAT